MYAGLGAIVARWGGDVNQIFTLTTFRSFGYLIGVETVSGFDGPGRIFLCNRIPLLRSLIFVVREYALAAPVGALPFGVERERKDSGHSCSVIVAAIVHRKGKSRLTLLRAARYGGQAMTGDESG